MQKHSLIPREHWTLVFNNNSNNSNNNNCNNKNNNNNKEEEAASQGLWLYIFASPDQSKIVTQVFPSPSAF